MAAQTGIARIIYGKLTSTSEYDVVAKTADVELTDARSIGEQLLLGSLPHGGTFTEIIAHFHPVGGRHAIVRYTPYAWLDKHGRESILTDIVLVEPAVFAQHRCNPFAFVPFSEGTFEVLQTLPSFEPHADSEATESTFLREFEATQTGFTDLVAAALEGSRVLLLDAGECQDRIRALVYLLPVGVRSHVTFHARCFHPADPLPRISVASEFHASLRGVKWSSILPEDRDELPRNPAEKLIRLIHEPARLARVHAAYAALNGGYANLRDAGLALARIDDFQRHCDQSNSAAAIQVLAKATDQEIAALAPELQQRFSASAIADAFAQVVRSATEDDTLARVLANGGWEDEVLRKIADWQIDARDGVGPRTGAVLVERLAVMPDVSRAVACIARLQPTPSSLTLSERASADLRALTDALLARERELHATARATRVLAAYGKLHPVLDKRARQAVSEQCRAAVSRALDTARPTRADVDALRQLQEAAREETVKDLLGGDLAARLFADIKRVPEATVQSTAKSLAREVAGEAAVANAVALLVSAWHEDDATARKQVAAAAELLNGVGSGEAVRIVHLLNEYDISEARLIQNQTFEPVLHFLGSTGRLASHIRSLTAGLDDLFAAGGRPGRLADAVFACRVAHVELHPASKPVQILLDSIAENRTSIAAQPGEDPQAPHKAEIALDLLAEIMHPSALHTVEQALAQRTGVADFRLRRLDRAYEHCLRACDENLHAQLITDMNADSARLPADMRARLEKALGLRSLWQKVLDGLNTTLSGSRDA